MPLMRDTLEFAAAVLEHPRVMETPAIQHDSDAALVAASQRGDTDAFGQLYRRYARLIHGILISRVRPVEVEDLVQDVFVRALPRLRDLRDASRFGAWLSTIARNIATDHYRHAQTQPESPADSVDPDEQPTKASPLGTSNEAAEILECIRSLPEAYREPLILRLVEGMTGPEIAARTGLSPGSVRVNLHRGMQQLRQKLSQRESRITAPGEKSGGRQI
jgi:RNA polymerase sigma-70 factor (ECF subfamily)